MKHLILLFVLFLLPLNVLAQSGKTGELDWSLSDGTLTISGAAIPDYSPYPIYGASATYSPWYDYRESITSVIIGDGVTDIGRAAFYGCANLSSINIPASATLLYDSFDGCTGLTSITVDTEHTLYSSVNGVLFNKDKTTLIRCPEGKTGYYSVPSTVTFIGPFAFYGSSMTSIFIPESVTHFESRTFGDCTSLTSLIVEWTTPIALAPDMLGSPTPITSLASITLYIPNGTRTNYATDDRYVWKEFTIEEYDPAVGTIEGSSLGWKFANGTLIISGAGAMPDYTWDSKKPWDDYKESIIALEIEDGVESIGNAAFYGYDHLTSVMIPGSVTRIGNKAFVSCDALESVSITGDSETTIGEYAFQDCSALTTVYLTGDITVIGKSAFTGCGALESVTIPAGVENIGNGAFDCGKLSSITVDPANLYYSSAEGVLFNRDMTFLVQYPRGKTGESYVIPNGVTSIGHGAFLSSSLLEVTIPESMETIGDIAFVDFKGKDISIPASVTSIGMGAFGKCALTNVFVAWTDPAIVTVDVYAFDGTSLSATILHVPADTKSAYEAAAIWNTFGTIVEEGEETNVVARGTTGPLTWMLISDGTLTISGEGAMPDYSGFADVPWSAHRSFTTVVIEEGVTHIGRLAFMEYYQDITSVSIPGSVTTIGEYAFAYCNMASVVIPTGVTTIGEGAFAFCHKLTSITIPAGVTAIGKEAFLACANLQTITIPASVTTIGSIAFGKCAFTDFIVAWTDPAAVTVDAHAFTSSTISTATLHVPAGTKSKYEAAAVWQDFGTIVEDGEVDEPEVTEPEVDEPEVVEIPDTEDNGLEITAPAPEGNEGTINISFNLPVNGTFACSFLFTLPQGFRLNVDATALANDLVADYQLTITQRAGGVWLFEISLKPASRGLRAATSLRNLVNIVYTIVEPTAAGTYEAKLANVELQLSDGSVIRENEITVPIRLSTPTSVLPVNNNPYVHYYGDILTVNTPVAESVEVYTLTGQLLYKAQKAAGEATYRIHNLPEGILIVRGSSGWTRKILY